MQMGAGLLALASRSWLLGSMLWVGEQFAADVPALSSSCGAIFTPHLLPPESRQGTADSIPKRAHNARTQS